MKLILGITGASGSIYAKRIIEIVKQYPQLVENLAIVFTDTAIKVWQHEIDDLKIENIPFEIFKNDNYFVPFASGSANYDAMVVCPCSMGTMAKIANSIADNLLTRAADVMLKESRNLIIVPRETPVNLIHISNMKKLVLAGAKICPASPSFYSKPTSIQQVVDTVVQKIFQLLKVDLKFFEWMKFS
ncbi:MAG: UbiX family flavin prenyltransferase [Bacteroidales bacterium]|nr:UbiX family flavin prenyltransferase [Bacteroidales bacterium]